MEDIIDRVLAYRISLELVRRTIAGDWVTTHVGIEEPKREIAAGVHRETDLGQHVMRSRCGLGTTKGAFEVGIADLELIIVLRVWLEFMSFDLYMPGPLVRVLSLRNSSRCSLFLP